MGRKNFTYINLPIHLVETIEKAINKIRINGEPKYTDKHHFIRTAISKLLEEEGFIMKEVAISK